MREREREREREGLKLAFGSFILIGSFGFWIHGLRVWIYMSSGYWVLDSGWVVGISYLVGFGQRTLGMKLGW